MENKEYVNVCTFLDGSILYKKENNEGWKSYYIKLTKEDELQNIWWENCENYNKEIVIAILKDCYNIDLNKIIYDAFEAGYDEAIKLNNNITNNKGFYEILGEYINKINEQDKI